MGTMTEKIMEKIRNYFKMYLFLISALSLILSSTSAMGAIIQVPADYLTIQAGINAAVNGDTVLVADGTYKGTGNKDLDFNGKAITVQSENGPENTIIDCENDGRGFYFHSGEGNNSVVSGLTITNGWAHTFLYSGNGGGIEILNSSPSIINCIIIMNKADLYGGGIYCNSASPIITNCTVSQNTCTNGGAGIYLNESFPNIDNSTINENGTTNGSAGIQCNYSSPSISNSNINKNSGVGIYCYFSSPTIINCNINENLSGGIYLYESSPNISGTTINFNQNNTDGGGIYCFNSSPTMSNSIIKGNESAGRGGGIYCRQSFFSISDCMIAENTAYSHGGGIYYKDCREPVTPPLLINCKIIGNTTIESLPDFAGGGGIYCEESPISMTNCIISGNISPGRGGGIYFYASAASLTNCTIADNNRGMFFYSSQPTLTNCILWGDSQPEIEGAPIIRYSNIQGGYTGPGNINSDPLFSGQGDYHLTISSPCINKATSVGAPNADIEGNLRPYDDAYDMGAYEYVGPPPPPPNQKPVVNAGIDQTIFNSVTLDGIASSDSDGTITSWAWTLTHRTNSAFNKTATGSNPTITDLSAGFYDVELTVTDNSGGTDTDTMLLGVAGTWDTNGDGKIGLEEAIHALQVVSGVRAE